MIPVWVIAIGTVEVMVAGEVHAANNNQQINFQGKIVNKTGGTNITDGTYSFTFKIFDASSGGNQLWSETQSSVSVTNGIFQVALGSTSSLSSLNFTNPNLWLDVTFNGETFGSRIQLDAVPTAIDALNLDGVVATQSASGFNLAGGTSTVSTVAFTTSGNTLTVQPGNAGSLTVQSNGANGLTLDTGSASSVSVGTANASSITIGNTSASNNTAITLTTGGSGIITLGSNTGVGNVVVQPNAGGQAALLIKDNGAGDLLTASAGATPKFVVSNAGVLSLIGGQTTDLDTIGTTNTLKIGTNNQNGLTLGRNGAATTIDGLGLTIGPTSWTATPTISGLVTASSGISLAAGQSYTGAGLVTLSSGAGAALTIDSGTTGALNLGTGANGKTITIGNTAANTALTLTTGGSGIITLGSNTGVGNVVIQPNAGGQAALVVNDQGGGDIFTASSSGTTRLRISSTGGVLFQGDTLTSIGSGASGNGSNAVENALGDEGSMVPNAGFESAMSNAIADGWFPAATTSAGVFTHDNSTAAKGQASLKVTITNSTAVIYSSCVPLSGAAGKYTLNYYIKGAAPLANIGAWIDGYTSKANCQSDNTPTLAVAQVAPATTSWTKRGTGTTPIGSFGATATWGRVHFLVSCTSGCTGSVTNIDGVRLTESDTGQGLDYAENYPADPHNVPQPGDIVSLEVLHGVAAVIPASKPQQDSSVIGVVSTNPGQVLDDGSVTDPKVSIALAGRIPTKVSTQNGPIHIGDYLTSSNIPGVAVKAVTAGDVVGVAMEDYTESDATVIGKVVMFVKNGYYDGGSGLADAPAGMTSFLGTQQVTQASNQNTILSSSSKSVSTQSLSENFLSLSSNGLATISGTLRVKENGLFEGIVTVLDTLTTHNLIVNSLSDFFDTVVFHKSVQFATAPTLPKDTAGFAVIHRGARNVDVHFSGSYSQTPIIQASLTTHITADATASAQALLKNNYAFVVTHESSNGFGILLNKEAQDDVYLSWVALSVDKPNLFESASTVSVLGTQTTPTPVPSIFTPSLTNIQSASGSAGK